MPVNNYTNERRLGEMTFMRVPQEVANVTTIPIYKVGTPNVLTLTTM